MYVQAPGTTYSIRSTELFFFQCILAMHAKTEIITRIEKKWDDRKEQKKDEGKMEDGKKNGKTFSHACWMYPVQKKMKWIKPHI